LISNFDSTLNFEFRGSFCQHLSVIVFDLLVCHLFRKKAGFIKKMITSEPLKINNCFFFFFVEYVPICHSRCFGIRGGHGKSAFKLAVKLSVELGYFFLSLRL
jgi:hypothetical protein